MFVWAYRIGLHERNNKRDTSANLSLFGRKGRNCMTKVRLAVALRATKSGGTLVAIFLGEVRKFERGATQ